MLKQKRGFLLGRKDQKLSIKNQKKGFLLGEETVKIIIALIVIVFLVYFLFYLYNASSNRKELAQADSTLTHLIQEANSGNDVEIYNPNGWYILSWPHNVARRNFPYISKTISMEIPSACSNMGWDKCLCICEEDGGKECDNLGKCVQSDIGVRGYKIKIKPPMALAIKNKVIEIK